MARYRPVVMPPQPSLAMNTGCRHAAARLSLSEVIQLSKQFTLGRCCDVVGENCGKLRPSCETDSAGKRSAVEVQVWDHCIPRLK